MNINLTEKRIKETGAIYEFVNYLKRNQETLNISDANLYCDFPVYKDLDEEVIVAQLLIASKSHGLLLFYISDIINPSEFKDESENISNSLDNLYSTIFSRLLRNKELKESRNSIKIPIESIVFTPLISGEISFDDYDSTLLKSYKEIEEFFHNNTEVISDDTYIELVTTIEGSKGVMKSKIRENVKENSKGDAVNKLEKEIAQFDEYQKSAYSSVLEGVSRIRGLAGSGKTVVLALKAALTHLRDPEAKIAYTFYTKSLYQHIQRLITRFYRQFDDKDPNWNKLEIIHAWGSVNTPGVYYNACKQNEISYLSYTNASYISKNAFSAACDDFISKVNNPQKVYDYIFIDEGQDFPKSFLKMCIEITTDKKVVWAYDDLQTIFQAKAPSPQEIFGADEKGQPLIDFYEDIVLYKCYRNPRLIILVAHAIGFGIYGNRIVQMIDSADYWNDIGYEIESGELKEGSKVKILRPEANSLISISDKYANDEIIKANYFSDFTKEVFFVCESINKDIEDGLLPEDILVISVDDKNASKYLNYIQEVLAKKYNRLSNNIHSDKFAIKDFQIKGKVTLSTVHKAKGNEAYSVYVVGIDSLFSLNPSIRERNILFTAMTRSKAWLSLTGMGDSAKLCCEEIQKAITKFPYLEFDYPTGKDTRIMKREMKDKAIRRSKTKQMLDDLLSELSPEEIQRYINQSTTKKKK
ncbi:ATP-binding domain-containing protein [uncultured Draconibacterium sp.]|uniref:DEAD/DEAH box helicase n=1 Tax=uncultured Draconibacterium sp. TaxID=1573823 RepID=UPI0032607ECE